MNKQQDTPALSTHDFVALGLDHMAYVRNVKIDGRAFYAVHAADGTEVTVLPTRAQADAAIRQHDLMPVWLH